MALSKTQGNFPWHLEYTKADEVSHHIIEALNLECPWGGSWGMCLASGEWLPWDLYTNWIDLSQAFPWDLDGQDLFFIMNLENFLIFHTSSLQAFQLQIGIWKTWFSHLSWLWKLIERSQVAHSALKCWQYNGYSNWTNTNKMGARTGMICW